MKASSPSRNLPMWTQRGYAGTCREICLGQIWALIQVLDVANYELVLPFPEEKKWSKDCSWKNFLHFLFSFSLWLPYKWCSWVQPLWRKDQILHSDNKCRVKSEMEISADIKEDFSVWLCRGKKKKLLHFLETQAAGNKLCWLFKFRFLSGEKSVWDTKE